MECRLLLNVVVCKGTTSSAIFKLLSSKNLIKKVRIKNEENKPDAADQVEYPLCPEF
uniref:Candidate secreted effector n=1 Tax=Meloidogyne incognita TaxID=6306 RepID=A0A914L9W6_MELIC